MKSVLRSAFDPVPRPLSAGTQLLVAGLLIAGITLSVVEYLEHSPPASLAQEPASQPASLELGTRAGAPAEFGARTRGLVGATPSPGEPTGATGAGSADLPLTDFSREPDPASAAPMSLQPGRGG